MPDLTPYMNTIIIVAVVVAVLIGLLIVARSMTGGVRARRGARLGVSEYREIDKSRRLLLIRRDNVEHLVLIGGAHDLVIEQNILPGDLDADYEPQVHAAPELAAGTGQAREPDLPRPAVGDDPAPQPLPPLPGARRAAPRPPVFGGNSPNIRPVDRLEPHLERPADLDN